MMMIGLRNEADKKALMIKTQGLKPDSDDENMPEAKDFVELSKQPTAWLKSFAPMVSTLYRGTMDLYALLSTADTVTEAPPLQPEVSATEIKATAPQWGAGREPETAHPPPTLAITEPITDSEEEEVALGNLGKSREIETSQDPITEPLANDLPEMRYQKFYDLHNINAGYGIEHVEKQRALEAFLDGISEDWLDPYHDWHDDSGRPPYKLQRRYRRKIKVAKTGASGTEETKYVEADSRSPTPELSVDKFCGKPFLCDTCKIDTCTFEVHDDDWHGCHTCANLTKALNEAAYKTDMERSKPDHLKKATAEIAAITKPESESDPNE